MDPGLLLMFVCSTHQHFRVDLICCLLYKDSSFLFVIFSSSSSSSSLALFVHWWETRGVIQMPTPYYSRPSAVPIQPQQWSEKKTISKKKSPDTHKRGPNDIKTSISIVGYIHIPSDLFGHCGCCCCCVSVYNCFLTGERSNVRDSNR